MEQQPKRLGEYLQEDLGVKGYQLYLGLQEQMRLQGEGKYRPLGQLMQEMGLASENQVNEALERQGQDMVSCFVRHKHGR